MEQMIPIPSSVLDDLFVNLSGLQASLPAPTWRVVEHNLRRLQQAVVNSQNAEVKDQK